ncbi:hypothetical protein [Nocardia rosealba]|uniref:hypothetical protein n=1 Tax=Nocardia rosealba TaxID=2878563 RepID=UPI001CD96EF3|nr:hypothetical protein [Nocardia rosealba]MCA2206196.1 hypothetical protein [Nocardia rosealba]
MAKLSNRMFATVIIGLSVAGCTGPVVVREQEPPISSASPELVAEATEFGDWSLPPEGEVLLVRKQALDDPTYNLVVETSPTGLAWMLEQSKYSAPFEKRYSIDPDLDAVIAGPSLETSPNVVKAQDLFVSKEGDSMIRDVIVDERTAELRIVHLEFRGQ